MSYDALGNLLNLKDSVSSCVKCKVLYRNITATTERLPTIRQASALVIYIEHFTGSLQYSYKVHMKESLRIPITLGRKYLSSIWLHFRL